MSASPRILNIALGLLLLSILSAPVQAQATRDPNATAAYEQGLKFMEEKKWDDALLVFEKLLKEFPYSKWVTEAQYYICETEFQVRDFKATADCVSQMVEMFPESELTGFQMMRLAQVHEMNGQVDEASEIYQIIQSQFDEPILKRQSLESIRRLEKR